MRSLAILIDDDQITHLFTTRILNVKFPRLPVKNFISAREAIDFLDHQDLNGTTEVNLFLDLNMPGMNGWEFMDHLDRKSFSFEVRVFVLTSSINRDDQEKCKKYSLIESFISKPLSLKKIEALGLNQ